jgi:WD40 repeat protein
MLLPPAVVGGPPLIPETKHFDAYTSSETIPDPSGPSAPPPRTGYYGATTRALVRGLSGLAADESGRVMAEGLVRFVNRFVRVQGKEEQRRGRPVPTVEFHYDSSLVLADGLQAPATLQLPVYSHWAVLIDPGLPGADGRARRNSFTHLRGLAEALTRQGYPRDQVRLHYGSAATASAVLQSLEDVRTRSHPADLLFLFYSGEGRLDASTGALHLAVTPSGEGRDDGFLPLSSLLDAVHEGPRAFLVFEVDDEAFTWAAREAALGAAFLAGRPESADGFADGAFYQSLLRGLTGLADLTRNGSVSVADLIRYVISECEETDRVTGRLNVSSSDRPPNEALGDPQVFGGLAVVGVQPAEPPEPDGPTVDGLRLRASYDLPGPATCMASSADGKWLAIGSVSGGVRVFADWVAPLESVQLFGQDAVLAIAWSPDAHQLAITQPNDRLQVWSITADPSLLSAFSQVRAYESQTLVWTRSGDLYWPAADALVRRAVSGASAEQTVSVQEAEFRSIIRVLAPSPNGRELAVGLNDGSVLIWRTDIKERMQTFTPVSEDPTTARDWITALAWSPEDSTTARDEITALVWSPDGALLAVGSTRGRVHLWHPESNRQGTMPKGPWDPVTSLSFSSDGRLLASKSQDGTVKLRRCDTGVTVAEFEEPPEWYYDRALAFHPNEPLLATGGPQSRELRVWEVDVERLVAKGEGELLPMFQAPGRPAPLLSIRQEPVHPKDVRQPFDEREEPNVVRDFEPPSRRIRYRTTAWLSHRDQWVKMFDPGDRIVELLDWRGQPFSIVGTCAPILGGSLGELMIAFHVPTDALLLDFDQWAPPDAPSTGLPLGVGFRLVVGTLYLRSESRNRPAWEKAWEHLGRQDRLAIRYVDGSSQSGSAAAVQPLIFRDVPPVFAFLYVPEPGELDQILETLAAGGAPTALFVRRAVADVDSARKLLDSFLASATLADLPDRVRDLRLAGAMSGDPDHIGHHLTLLWDDPTRLPPDSAAFMAP